MVALWCGGAWAYDFSAVCSSGQMLYYTITNASQSRAEVVSDDINFTYLAFTGNLEIPSSVRYGAKTYSVTSIEESAFENCSGLTSVTILSSSIGNRAFYNCSGLTSVTIGNSVTNIHAYAFADCSGLTSVTIPSSVTGIDGYAFANCSGLTTVNFDATNCSFSSYYSAWSGCSSLSTLNIGSNVTNITANAFGGCSGLTEVTIPNSVTSIGNRAFGGCSGLTEITISRSVTSFGDDAFVGCNGLTRVNYTGGIDQWCMITFNNETANPLNFAHNLYVNNNLVADLVIPNNIWQIKNYTFCGASSLTSVTINDVSRIGSSAFQDCSGLTSIIIPSSITSIGDYAFANCSGMASLTIGSNVTSIAEGAFARCSGLATINYNATNCTTMGSSDSPAFINSNADATINIGSNVTAIPEYAFIGILGNGTLVVPNPVTSIGQCAFKNCVGYTSLTIWNSVTSIGESSFENCSGLTSVTIPSSVTRVGNRAFYNCSGLTSVTIGSGVTNIGESSFENCSGLTSVTIPSSVTSIGTSVFSGCSGLTSITIPNSVTGIGTSAFSSCSGLTSLTIPNSVTSIGASAFSGCRGLTSVTIGNSVTSIGNGAFGNCSGLTSITIPNSVTSIGRSAFYNCSSLIDITIPFVGSRADLPSTTISESSVFGYIFGYSTYSQTGTIQQYYSSSSKIYAYIPSSLRSVTVTGGRLRYGAFYNCSMLTSVTIGEDVTDIENYAFYNCSGLTDIYVNRTTPPTVLSASFNIRTATVWVPCGSASAYRAATGWSGFGDIRESRTYMLSVSSTNPQQGTAIVTQQPDCTNGTAIIEAMPNIGHYFAQWNDGNTDNPRTITVTSGVTYVAEFGISQHNITVVSADMTMGTVSGSGTYGYGTEIQISAIPSDGYRFTAWNDGDTDNPRSITVTQDSTFTANFIALHNITVVSADEEMGTATGTGVYDENSEIQISATPANHYHFVQWNDGNTDNPRTITVSEDATYTAEFAIDQHTITVESANTEMGTVSESGTYDYGTEIEISASASEHYHFVQWNDGNTDNPRTITVVEDSTFTAEFAIDRFTVTVESADTEMGTVSESGTYDYGTEIEISASASEHYHFVQWSDGNTDNPRMITVVEDTTFTAEFAIDQHTITVESADTEMGTVSEGGTYDYGTEIQISASARDGYQFASWNDDNTDNPRYITVTSDATYIASFIPAVGIDESIATEITLFPNPVNDILNITSSETISEIEIVNVMGQVVKRIEVNSDNVVCNVEDLKAGVYVVRIRIASATLSQRRFVKE